ncbi:MAG: DUF4282 domain-containing protein [Gemmataceae bacterium]|nr:DUF4282 domain-containing protein [Gemmataceae bacterium]
MPPPHEPWLIARLFDFSFSRFVSLSLIRLAYFLLAVAGLVPLLFGVFLLFQIGQDFQDALVLAVVLMVAAPFIYLVYLFLLRLLCETLIVLFAVAEHLAEIRETLKRAADSPPPSSPS